MEKKVKLSLSSTNEEMLSTMINEGKSVEYWHKKAGEMTYQEIVGITKAMDSVTT